MFPYVEVTKNQGESQSLGTGEGSVCWLVPPVRVLERSEDGLPRVKDRRATWL